MYVRSERYGEGEENTLYSRVRCTFSNHCVMPIKDGKIQCGFAQDIYFAEFDGPQVRKIFIQVMGE